MILFSKYYILVKIGLAALTIHHARAQQFWTGIENVCSNKRVKNKIPNNK